MELLLVLLGLLLLSLTLWDVFETIVVPRPTPGWFRIGRYLVRSTWRVVRAFAGPGPDRSATAERALGLFAPAATIMLLVAWLVALFVAFGLILFGLRDQLQPQPPNIGTAIYFAASSVLTSAMATSSRRGRWPGSPSSRRPSAGSGSWRSWSRSCSRSTGRTSAARPPSCSSRRRPGHRCRPSSSREPRPVRAVRSPAAVLRRVGALDRGGARLARRLPAAGLLPIEPRQPVVDQCARDGPRYGDPRPHDDRRCSTRPGGARQGPGDHLVEDITNLGNRTPASSSLDRPSFDAVYERLAAAGYRLVPEDEAWPAFAAARAPTRIDSSRWPSSGWRRPCRGSAAARRFGRRRTGRRATRLPAPAPRREPESPEPS